MRLHTCPAHFLQSHLDEVAWRRRHRNDPRTILECFWHDASKFHGLGDRYSINQ